MKQLPLSVWVEGWRDPIYCTNRHGLTGFFPSNVCNRTRESGLETLLRVAFTIRGGVIAPAPRFIAAYNAQVLGSRRAPSVYNRAQKCQNNYESQAPSSINLWTWLLWSRLWDASGGVPCCCHVTRSSGVRFCASRGYGITDTRFRAVTLQRRHTMAATKKALVTTRSDVHK